jgi:hypothetical protein
MCVFISSIACQSLLECLLCHCCMHTHIHTRTCMFVFVCVGLIHMYTYTWVCVHVRPKVPEESVTAFKK